MDGVHDMGGMDGFGKVEVEPNEPPFHEPWEGRVLAMQRAMGYAGAWHIDHSRYAQERLPPVTYLSVSYYQRWALAMEKNVLERGYATPDELKAGHAQTPGKSLQAQAHARRGSGGTHAQLVLPPAAGPRAVQARRQGAHEEHPSGDAHAAAALRARQARHRRAVPRLPHVSGLGRVRQGDNPQWLYTVVFEARELWGDDADPTIKISIDAFEPYLERA
jgi:nitrile hydratase subunit beta